MNPRQHVIASAAVSAGIYVVAGSPKMAAASFIAGVLLDIDHLFDYWKYHSFNLNFSKFFNTCNECDFQETRLFFHSLELLIIMSAASYFSRSGLITALTLGICQHLALDQLKNKVYPASYVLIYRWANAFKVEKVFSVAREKQWE